MLRKLWNNPVTGNIIFGGFMALAVSAAILGAYVLGELCP